MTAMVDHPFPRRILLAVTGLSPQVVTETLYALGTTASSPADARFIPTEIHLLTTTVGAQLARTALLHPTYGQFRALMADYPVLGQPAFSEQNIHVIGDTLDRPLEDIRTPGENACAADTITAVLAELTRDASTALHVSIAGGRKTMGFYLGYAFSLFARPQDQLSHVLVSSPFENLPEFFYPPPESRCLTTRDGLKVDAADAIVTLAHIPVVRLRHGQPQALLQGQASFNETVQAIQEGLAPPQLKIDLPQRQVICGRTHVRLPAALLAWYAWWAQQRLGDHGPQSWRTANPQGFLDLYARLVGRHSAALENAQTRLQAGMEKAFFQENNAKLERALKQQLGLAATPYLLQTSGKRPYTSRELGLPISVIALLI